VAITDINSKIGQETAKEFTERFGEERVFWKECDITSYEQFEQLYIDTEAYFNQPVNMLVNNAGITHKPGWKKCMDVNIVRLLCKYELMESHLQTNGYSRWVE